MKTTPSPEITIRPAVAGDVPLILDFIRQLAQYEKLEHAVFVTEQRLHDQLFGPRRVGDALLAYLANEPVGYAIFFSSISTFVGLPGIFLEDLFVKPDARGRGVGKALLAQVASIARQRGCARLEWAALNWNEPAIRFYRSLGAKTLDEWTSFRLAGEDLLRLAETGQARGH